MNEILQWVKFPDYKLDHKLFEYITTNTLDFITVYDRILHKSGITDESILTRLENSFSRLADRFIDSETDAIVKEWEGMTDAELSDSILDISVMSGHSELIRICSLIYNRDTKNRVEKILYELAPKFRQINILRMLINWSKLSDRDLVAEITRALVGSGMDSSTSHISFVSELYSNITDDALRKRVDRILLAMAEPEYLENDPSGGSERALFACLKLNIPGGRECLVHMVQHIKNPFDTTYRSIVNWLNSDILRDYPIPEAENFLVTQVKSAPHDIAELLKNPSSLPHNEYYQLQSLFTALQRLKAINPEVAKYYADKLNLPI
jgi:hypothetical protein